MTPASSKRGPRPEEGDLEEEDTAGVHIKNGVTISAQLYLNALWRACQAEADAGTRSRPQLDARIVLFTQS
jgi:hypothetical protein